MFGSLFRSAVVIGTIYAISPVKLDATPYPAGSSVPAPSKNAQTGQGAKGGLERPAQLAPIAAPLTAHLVAAAAGGLPAKGSTDQIGDLIALGKDLCLANPGLCLEAAKALHEPKPQEKGVQEKTVQEKTVQEKVTQDKNSQKIQPAPKQAEPAKSKQPDALAALIEKTVTPPAPALVKPLR